MNIENYWRAVVRQDKEEIRTYFHDDACICWHNTNEKFDLESFLCANCEYPDQWDKDIEKVITLDNEVICVVRVYTKSNSMSFHVTSFITLLEDKIIHIDEYWGDDGEVPKWRQELQLSVNIKE